jgi:hypothetical protein
LETKPGVAVSLTMSQPRWACAVLDGVEHDRLARAASAGVERRAARRSRAIFKCLGEVIEQVVAADQQRRADTEARVEWVAHPTAMTDPFRAF